MMSAIARCIMFGRVGANASVTALLAVLVVAGLALGHCDAEDGPVAKDVTRAIAQADVVPILKWINEADEQEMKGVFEQALRVRAAGGEAQVMADRYVLETAVRLHRMREGAPYTGIKPAGQLLPVPVVAVDRAMATGEIDALINKLQDQVEIEVRQRFDRAWHGKQIASQSVEDGRHAVHAYVELVHYVLALHQTLQTSRHPGSDCESSDDHDHAATPSALEPSAAKKSPCCESHE